MLAILVAGIGTLLSVPLLVLTSHGQSGNPVVLRPVPGTPPATVSPAPTPSAPRTSGAPTSAPPTVGSEVPSPPGSPGSPSRPVPSATSSPPSPRPSAGGGQVTIGQLSIALALPPSPGGPSTLLTALGTVMTPVVALVTFLLGRRRGMAEGRQPDGDEGPGGT